ncbi:MAG: hypothetical protein ACKO5K_00815 [Armatimonadota bacterium]
MSSAGEPADIRTYGRFGRFGRVHDDGLLTVGVTPRGFDSLPGSVPFHVRWGDPMAPLAAVVPTINPTEKTLAIEGGGDGAPTMVRYTLLYPGLAAWFGARMVLHFVDAKGQPMRTAIDPSRYRRGDGILVIPGDRFPATPLWIAPPGPEGLKVWHDGANLSFESSGEIGEVRFATPVGIGVVRSLREAWDMALALRDVPVSRRSSVQHRLVDDGKTLESIESFSEACAPIPPALAVALDHGYPGTIDGPEVSTAVLTPCGPWRYVARQTLVTRLPLPPTVRRGLVRSEPAVKAGTDRLRRAARLAGAAAPPPPAVAPLLDTPDRLRWSDRSREVAESLWSASPSQWVADSEPITAHSYVRAVAPGDSLGRKSMVGAPMDIELARLEGWLAQRGDWSVARNWWPGILRSRRFGDLSEDWAWMLPCTGDHGGGTGSAKEVGAAFSGAVAAWRLAMRLGTPAERVRSATRAAHVAVGALARLWWTPRARKAGWIPADAWIGGFREKTGWEVVRPGVGEDAWADLVGGSDAGNDWLRWMGTHARGEGVRLIAERERHVPRWGRGGANASNATDRADAAHLLARRVLGVESPSDSHRRIAALRNPKVPDPLWWRCAAESAAFGSPILLLDWADLGYESGTYRADGDAALLRFRADATGRRRVEFALSRSIRLRDVRIDDAVLAVEGVGGRYAWTHRFAEGTTEVRLRFLGAGGGDGPLLSDAPSPPSPRPGSFGLAPLGGAW